MHRRVQRLDAAVQHLRETSHVRHVDDGKAGGGDRLRGAARRNQLDATFDKAAGKLGQAGLVRDTQNCAHGIHSTDVTALTLRVP